MHTRVFRNKLGLPTYEAKDLGLAKTKWGRYKYDLSYIVTANEITEYFKVVLRVMEQLYPELRAKTTHMPHGMMKLTTGKMSSRSGVVVTGEGLLNDLHTAVLSKMGERDIKDRELVADVVAVGSLKYTVLKQAVGGDIVYEPDKMTNLEGNTGPFVQYTYARAKSILRKFKIINSQILKSEGGKLLEQEMSILRWLYRYPEVVSEAGSHFSPHLVATYIYELSQRFNSFYQACRVEENGEVNELRYLLTQATANILQSGLGLLGIQAPAEM
jgi:arginyl-tRNA synthetase